jgi:hypothetical protein
LSVLLVCVGLITLLMIIYKATTKFGLC